MSTQSDRIGSFVFRLLLLAFVVAILSSLLTGCAAVSNLPSLQHCAHVVYERTGQKVYIEAECTAPVGGPGL